MISYIFFACVLAVSRISFKFCRQISFGPMPNPLYFDGNPDEMTRYQIYNVTALDGKL